MRWLAHGILSAARIGLQLLFLFSMSIGSYSSEVLMQCDAWSSCSNAFSSVSHYSRIESLDLCLGVQSGLAMPSDIGLGDTQLDSKPHFLGELKR